MSLLYFCGDGHTRARMARHSLGMDVILCAPGPSMEPVERQPGIMVAALTKAYPIVKPDIWFGMDTPECYDRALWAESFLKVSKAGYQDFELHGRKIKTFPQTYFADLREGFVSDIFRHRTHDTAFLWKKDTLMAALHALIWMGAGAGDTCIYFNGFDLRHIDGQDYTHGVEKKLTPELRARNQVLFNKQVAHLAEFTRLAKLNGINLCSTTLGSPINQFMPYRSLRVAIDWAKRDVPRPEPLMHSFETPIGRKYLERLARGKVLPFTPAGADAALKRARIKEIARKHGKPVHIPAAYGVIPLDPNRPLVRFDPEFKGISPRMVLDMGPPRSA